MPGNDRSRPLGAAPATDDRASRHDHSENIATDDGPEWLAEYPPWVCEAVRMDKRRRAASLRLEPLPSGKRDPRDLVARDAPSDPEAA
jgi:hypothetical protein